MQFFATKTAVVVCVEDLLGRSDIEWRSITITKQEKSGVFSVDIATGTLLEDIVEEMDRLYSEVLIYTSPKNIPDG